MSNSTKNQLVTVILYCYKKFDYIFDTIDSILIQDYPEIELLVADDGSVNFPEKEISQYIEENKNQNIKQVYIRHNSKNLGTVKNLNSIIPLSKGEYIINIAGDDVFYDNSVISKIVKRFICTGADLLSCTRELCDERSLVHIGYLPSEKDISVILTMDTPEKQKRAFLAFDFHNIASGSATYYTKKHFEEFGYFDERYILWEDGPKYLSYANQGKCITTAYDIISIKYRDGGLSNSGHSIWNSNSKYEIDKKKYIKLALTDYPSYKEDIFQGIWRYWDWATNYRHRIYLMLYYPSFGIQILKNKLLHKPIR